MPSRREVIQGVAAALSQLTAARLETAFGLESAATLGAIRAVTITADRLQPVEDAWTKFMGYRVVRRGSLPASPLRRWRLGSASAFLWQAAPIRTAT